MRAIARRLNVNFKTVRRYVRASSADVLVAGGVQISVLDPFKPYLNDRLAEGVRNVTMLLAEITEKGYTCGYNTLNRYVRPLRRLDAAQLAELPPRAAAVRQVAGWITGLPSNLDPDDAVRRQAIRQRCPELDAAVKHVAGFARMIKNLSGDEHMLTKCRLPAGWDHPVARGFYDPGRKSAQVVPSKMAGDNQVDWCRRRRPARPPVVHRRVAPRPGGRRCRTDPALQLRCRRRHRQPHQATEGCTVRTR